MAPGARADRDQAIGALLKRLAGKADIDDVMHGETAIGMDGIVDFHPRAQRGDDQRHLVLHAHLDIVFQPVVGSVHDLVDREGRGRAVRILRVVIGQLAGDLVEPFVQLGFRARVQRRKAADHPGLALGNDEFRAGNDEER